MEGAKMTSSRPYILRAMYEWITDNGLTPYILVNAEFPGTLVPARHVEDGRIVLNIAPRAVTDWYIDNDWLGFSARFGGVAESVRIPVQAVLAIYARENGKGMVFEKEDDVPPPPAPERPPEPPRPRKPHLQVIK
jgi:stringent starvation protein B